MAKYFDLDNQNYFHLDEDTNNGNDFPFKTTDVNFPQFSPSSSTIVNSPTRSIRNSMSNSSAEDYGINNLSLQNEQMECIQEFEVDDAILITNSLTEYERHVSFLEILEQPTEKFRFRYKAEMQGTHGQLKGINNQKKVIKTFPTVQLHGYNGEAKIHCSLYQTQTLPPKLHSHRLLIRIDNRDSYDPIEKDVDPTVGYKAQFSGMGIMITKKEEVLRELIKKNISKKKLLENRELTEEENKQIDIDCNIQHKAVNMNEVCLCFEAFKIDEYTRKYIRLCEPVFSNPIQHDMGTKTGTLKIAHASKMAGSPEGNEELILLTEKVDKSNIKVKFFEDDSNGKRIFDVFASFPPSNVHRQYAIILNTPPYIKLDIEEDVKVNIQLYRPASKAGVKEDTSNIIPFIYKSSAHRPGGKRARPSTPQFCWPISVENPADIIDNSLDDYLKNIEDSSLKLEMIDLNFEERIDSLDLVSLKDGIPISFSENCSRDENLNNSLNSLKNFSISKIPNMFKDPKTHDHMLHRYVRHGKLEDTKKLLLILILAQGDSVLQLKNENGDTCLHVACNYRRSDFIDCLLKAGMDPNIKNANGYTPLHIGIENNDFATVSKLVESQLTFFKRQKKLAIDMSNHDGLTPLHLAIKKSNMKIITNLINCGNASVDELTKINKNNVLHLAVEKQDEELLRYLRKKVSSLQIYQENLKGITPIALAKSLPNAALINILTENVEIKEEPIDLDGHNYFKIKYFDESLIEILSKILKKNKKWKDLAKSLNYEKFLCIWKTPRVMLDYIKNDETVDINNFVNALNELNEFEAVEEIKNNLRKVIM